MLAALLLGTTLAASTPPTPTAALDTAIARMGGEPALRRVTRVRFELMTQWQRMSFGGAPYADGPSYEWHSDLRDYAAGTWRNTRRYPAGAGWRDITDVVRSDVAIRRIGGGPWGPLSVAYVDERRELFAFAPERVLLAARGAADLRALPDTTIGGAPHARVSATIDGFPTTLFLRRRDGLLAMTRFRAAQPNDFGLVPWGAMEVKLWLSRWQKQPNGVAYPMQWDVRRVGRPYKRVTVLAANLDAPAPADSFAVSDSLRMAFLATANRPMHDLPLDSARLVDPRLASFGTPGAPSGAVKLGHRWVLLETGSAPLSVERAAAWLARADSGTTLGAAIVASPSPQGGVAWLATHGVPVHVAPGARPFVTAILRNRDVPGASVAAVTGGRWLRVDGDSLWLEPIDLPDAPGTLVAYAPSLRWMYCGPAAGALQLDYVLALARARRWDVTRLGTVRAMAAPVPVETSAKR